MNLVQARISEDQFREWYCEAFMNEDVPLPANVYAIIDEGKRVAFCSVYVHSRGNLYLQYIGFAKDAEPGKKYGYYVETLKALHGLGFPFIMGAIESKNKRALMWALRSGFEIQGCRQDTGGNLFIEVLRQEEKAIA